MKLLQNLPILLAILVAGGAAVFVGSQLVSAGEAPDGPVDAVWDRDICAHCRMHLGEPGFAAQIQTDDGEILYFDDPGCAFELLAATGLQPRAVYFHHHREDRWLAEDQTVFVRVTPSPMGYGLAATDAGTPDSISVAEARRQILAKREN